MERLKLGRRESENRIHSRRTGQWYDLRPERGDPSYTQSGRSDILRLGNGLQCVDKHKVVLKILLREASEAASHVILWISMYSALGKGCDNESEKHTGNVVDALDSSCQESPTKRARRNRQVSPHVTTGRTYE